jgi:Mor family transcriptional regulator
MNTADMMIWVPTEEEMARVWEYLQGLTQEDINRLYYKNNLYSFADLPVISSLITKILCELDEPFMDPNKPPKNIKEDLDALVGMMKEYVYYPHFYIDKLDRIEYMQRDIVVVSDTDSTIISFDAWYRFVLNKVYNIDMPIKHQKRDMVEVIEADEWGDRPLREMVTYVEPEFDYDFYTDEVIELERLIEPCSLVPQDNLKYAIINIIAYICSDLIVDYLAEYT